MLSFLSRWPYAWCVMTNIIGNKQLEDKTFLRISGEPQIWLGTQQVDMTAAAIYGYKKQQSQGAGVMRKRLSDTGLQLTHKIKQFHPMSFKSSIGGWSEDASRRNRSRNVHTTKTVSCNNPLKGYHIIPCDIPCSFIVTPYAQKNKSRVLIVRMSKKSYLRKGPNDAKNSEKRQYEQVMYC
ncbi:hypothetical protein MG293_008071 [Ovis ammon polii]|uniref:Uncharacterized protein n=1 Tax=Ovis ammon polii TaxID=230172 RepID=A0AAD4UA52_OVIAM|nr:hypothetical protein MG293_008071 [Ovis ammon polii]KAI4570098.1 hypothetical protein MJT46_007392 [Ovis ammon polii x Ovis aries]